MRTRIIGVMAVVLLGCVAGRSAPAAATVESATNVAQSFVAGQGAKRSSEGGLGRVSEKPLSGETHRAPAMPTLVFGGGSVGELIEIMKETGRKGGLPALNVIVAKDMEGEYVPPFELHNVTYGDVFQALNLMQANQWQESGGGASGDGIWLLRSNIPTAQPFPFPQIDPLTGQPLGTKRPEICQIYTLQRYLGRYNLDDITTAIQTAWSMTGADKGAQLKYHKETSLLLAVGTPEQLEVISRVLRSLEEGMAYVTTVKKQSGEVFVNGAVNKPGAVPVAADQSLDILGALARAGGLTPKANENKIKFTRPGVMEKTLSLEYLKLGPKNNLVLQPGDIIEVSEKLF